MRARIDSNGWLYIYRHRQERFQEQYCPYAMPAQGMENGFRCGEWCPAFKVWTPETSGIPTVEPQVVLRCFHGEVVHELEGGSPDGES